MEIQGIEKSDENGNVVYDVVVLANFNIIKIRCIDENAAENVAKTLDFSVSTIKVD